MGEEMKIWAYVMLAVTAVGGFLTFMFSAKKAGADAEKAKHIDRIMENAKKAKRARRRVIDNLDHADKLRGRFTRK